MLLRMVEVYGMNNATWHLIKGGTPQSLESGGWSDPVPAPNNNSQKLSDTVKQNIHVKNYHTCGII